MDLKYRDSGQTVWFKKDPSEMLKGAFATESDWGEAVTVGRGNVFDERDIYRDALEQIVDEGRSERDIEIAQDALDTVDNIILEKMKAMKVKVKS